MERAGAKEYSERWGIFDELMIAGEHLPAIERSFGKHWPDITEVPTWIVIKVMARDVDRSRMMQLAQHYMNATPTK